MAKQIALEADIQGLRSHFGMSIKRYTESVQNAIGCNLHAEPWMHIAFFGIVNADDKHNVVEYYYVIYIWDTRQILAEGTCSIEQLEAAGSAYANDNHRFLHGTSEGAKRFNASVAPMWNKLKTKKPDFSNHKLKIND